MRFRHYLIIIILSINITACSTTTKTFQAGNIPEPIPVDQERLDESKSLIEQYAKHEEFELYQTGPEYERVLTIVNNLVTTAGAKENIYPVYMADAGEDRNAFAFNSSSIVVYKGLTDALKNDDELAVILAHEVGHILAQHTEDKTEKSRNVAVTVGAIILGTATSVLTGVDVVGDVVTEGTYQLGQGAFVLSYSRAQEYEADHIGMLLMAKAGYDPNLAVRLWAS